MKRMITIGLVLMLLVLGGCAKADPYGDANKSIKADGILLGQVETDLPKYITGGEKENCVYGYELRSATPEVTVGISGDRSMVRKIITAVPEHSIYGVAPGQELKTAEKTILDAGFKLEEGHKYVLNGIRVELLSMDNTKADRVGIEVVEK